MHGFQMFILSQYVFLYLTTYFLFSAGGHLKNVETMFRVTKLSGSALKVFENVWLKNAEEKVCTSKIELEQHIYLFI